MTDRTDEQHTRPMQQVRSLQPSPASTRVNLYASSTDPALRRASERMARQEPPALPPGHTDELEADEGVGPRWLEVRHENRRRAVQQRRQERLERRENQRQLTLDRLVFWRSVVWLLFGIVCLLIVATAGALVVGALYGAWTLPLGTPHH